MERQDLPGWRIAYDRAATQAAYAHIPRGGADSCACGPCRNWVRTRSDLFPASFTALLDALGIPPDRDCEVYHNGRLPTGKHSYAGWYHFVGAVEFGEREGSPFVEYPPFQVYFHSQPALLQKPFHGLRVATLEFSAEAPWLSEIPEAG
mgnify:CR=1 FL=1